MSIRSLIVAFGLSFMFLFPAFANAGEQESLSAQSEKPVLLAAAEGVDETATDSSVTEMPKTDAPEVVVDETADATAEAEEDEEKKEDKWWHISVGYSFSHNLSRERPLANNAFSLDPSFTIPGDVNVGLHLGFFVDTEYPGKEAGAGDRQITRNTVDMDPLMLNVSKRFSIDPDNSGFAISLALAQLFPSTSKYAGQATDWHYAIKPSVTLSLSKWGFTLSNQTGIQKNAHAYDYAERKSTADGGITYIPLNSWTVSNGTNLSYSVWKLNFMAGFRWAQSWRYHPQRQGARKNVLAYMGGISASPYKGLSVDLSISTAGPERRYGGFKNDHLIPLDPRFTNISFGLSYSY